MAKKLSKKSLQITLLVALVLANTPLVWSLAASSNNSLYFNYSSVASAIGIVGAIIMLVAWVNIAYILNAESRNNRTTIIILTLLVILAVVFSLFSAFTGSACAPGSATC